LDLDRPPRPDKAARVETPRKVPLLSRLSNDQLRDLAEASSVKNYARGELDPCPSFFIAHSGAVKIFKESPGGHEQVLTIERTGNSVAELPALDDGPYPAPAQAQEDSTLFLIPIASTPTSPHRSFARLRAGSANWSDWSRRLPSWKSDNAWPGSCSRRLTLTAHHFRWT
jgi:hypothetical protein